MNCRTCDYRLWNLHERRCPECGKPFLPSEYDFTPNAVEFCCPHCEQPYYGTDEHGHLQPKEFVCVRCGQPIRMDEMVVRPAAGVREEATVPEPLPWLQREQIGLLRAWARTVKLSLFNPAGMMKMLPPQTEGGHAHRFAAWTIFALWVPAGLLCLGFFGLVFKISGGGPRIGVAELAGPFCFLALAGLFSWCGIFVWGVITHLLLRAISSPLYPRHRTMQAICYSSGAMVVTLVPCFGMYAVGVWWLISALLAVKEAQQTSWPKAIIAAAGPPVVCFTILATLYFGGMWYTMSKVRTTTMTWPPTTLPASTASQSARIGKIVQSLQRYADQHAGQGPPHAMTLIADGLLQPNDLVRTSRTPLETVTFEVVGSTDAPNRSINMQVFARGTVEQQTRQAAWAAAALPKPGAPHRIGDIVFTYGGIDLFAPPPGVWLVIQTPGPLSPWTQTGYLVGRADGHVETITTDDFAGRFEKQNRFREEHGLPTIPHPDTIQPPPAEAP